MRLPNSPFIIASPLTHRGWSPQVLRSFLQGLKIRVPRIDWRRVYLTGDSMGGHATWAWATADPQQFAALAPVCAAGDPQMARQRISFTPATSH